MVSVQEAFVIRTRDVLDPDTFHAYKVYQRKINCQCNLLSNNIPYKDKFIKIKSYFVFF